MATAFTTSTTEWQGELRGGYETATKVAGLPTPSDGYLYRRKHTTASVWRLGVGLISWASKAGEAYYGDDLNIFNGDDDTNFGGEPDFIVTSNTLSADPPGSGIWRETMVAEAFTAWELWEIPTTTGGV